jgi:thiamine pyrophosphate-dependent acetolactate synthase large subunit-like protein
MVTTEATGVERPAGLAGTRGPAAAVVHDLVGLMHASMAVYNAFCDRVPLLLLGGSGPADRSRRRPVDWLHSATTQAELVRDFVKWDDEPSTAEAAVAAVLRADRLASSAPTGPVYVSLDAAEQDRALDGPVVLPDLARHTPTPPMRPDPDAVERAAEVLAQAALPVVVGGRVGLDPAATAPLTALVEALGTAYRDDRNLVGFPTVHPQNCSGAFGPPVPRDVHLAGDPLASLRLLGEAVAGRVDPARRAERAERVRQRHTALRARQRAALAAGWTDRPIRPARLVAETWAAVRGLPWLLVLRNTRTWPEGVWEFPGAGRYLGHSGGGGVGYGPGAMVGGALAGRDRGELGVAIVGDGELLMAAGALWTAVHYRIPLLVVVNDNASFHNDEQHQRRVAVRRGRPEENAWIGVRIAGPTIDIAGLARSYGCWATGPVEHPDQLAPALKEAAARAAAGDVAVVHARTAPQDRAQEPTEAPRER